MAAVSASITLLLTDLMLRLPESIWAIAAPDATLIAEATRVVDATAMTITGTGIETENVTVIALRAAKTETVVIGTRIGTGVTEGARAVNRLNALNARKGVTLAALVGRAQPVNVTVINPKSWRCSAIDSPVSGSKSLSFSSYQVSSPPFTVLYQDFKLKLFRQLA